MHTSDVNGFIIRMAKLAIALTLPEPCPRIDKSGGQHSYRSLPNRIYTEYLADLIVYTHDCDTFVSSYVSSISLVSMAERFCFCFHQPIHC